MYECERWDISSKSSSAEHPAQQLATFAAHSAPVLSLQVDWAEQIMVSASAVATSVDCTHVVTRRVGAGQH